MRFGAPYFKAMTDSPDLPETEEAFSSVDHSTQVYVRLQTTEERQ
jgi:hypothetical protein